MSGPCLCGDTECPWCGPMQGGPTPPDRPHKVEYDSLSEYSQALEGYCDYLEDRLGIHDEPDYPEDNMTDVEADADTLKSAGMGTDEDYGYFGEDYDE